MKKNKINSRFFLHSALHLRTNNTIIQLVNGPIDQRNYVIHPVLNCHSKGTPNMNNIKINRTFNSQISKENKNTQNTYETRFFDKIMMLIDCWIPKIRISKGLFRIRNGMWSI